MERILAQIQVGLMKSKNAIIINGQSWINEK